MNESKWKKMTVQQRHATEPYTLRLPTHRTQCIEAEMTKHMPFFTFAD